MAPSALLEAEAVTCAAEVATATGAGTPEKISRAASIRNPPRTRTGPR